MVSDGYGADRTQAIRDQAVFELLKMLLPQAFSSNEILGSGERGRIDEWKMTKFGGRVMLSLIYFRHRGVNDKVRFYRELVDYFIRGSHSIDGTNLKMLENISIGMTGGAGRGKIVKKPGWIGRHVTNRDWERKARDSGAAIAE